MIFQKEQAEEMPMPEPEIDYAAENWISVSAEDLKSGAKIEGAFFKITGKDPGVEAIHAGLECGSLRKNAAERSASTLRIWKSAAK